MRGGIGFGLGACMCGCGQSVAAAAEAAATTATAEAGAAEPAAVVGKPRVDDVVEDRAELPGDAEVDLVFRVGRQGALPQQDLFVGLALDGKKSLVADGSPVAAHVEAQPANDAELDAAVEPEAPLIRMVEVLEHVDAALEFSPGLGHVEVDQQRVVDESLFILHEDGLLEVAVVTHADLVGDRENPARRLAVREDVVLDAGGADDHELVVGKRCLPSCRLPRQAPMLAQALDGLVHDCPAARRADGFAAVVEDELALIVANIGTEAEFPRLGRPVRRPGEPEVVVRAPVLSADLSVQAEAHDPEVPGIVGRVDLQKAAVSLLHLLAYLELVDERRLGDVMHHADADHLRHSLASLVLGIGVAGDPDQANVVAGELLQPDELEGVLLAGARELRRHQDMDLRILAIPHVVDERDVLAQKILIASPAIAIEEDQQAGRLLLLLARIGLLVLLIGRLGLALRHRRAAVSPGLLQRRRQIKGLCRTRRLRERLGAQTTRRETERTGRKNQEGKPFHRCPVAPVSKDAEQGGKREPTGWGPRLAAGGSVPQSSVFDKQPCSIAPMILPSTDKKLGLIGLGGASVTGTGIYYRDENDILRVTITADGGIRYLDMNGTPRASMNDTGIGYHDENGTVRAAMIELGLIYWDIFGNPRACTISASVLMGLNLRGSLIC